MHGLKNQIFILRRNYKKHTCGLQSIIDKCRICGTEGETIEHINSKRYIIILMSHREEIP
jgi:hypothetical protein